MSRAHVLDEYDLARASGDPGTSWTQMQATANGHDVLRRCRLAYVGAPFPDPFEYAFYFRPTLRPIFETELHPAVLGLSPPVPWIEAATDLLQ
eukprot:6336456-Alexandrium_andersonii.AAC.1